jgi:hypothetical protein
VAPFYAGPLRIWSEVLPQCLVTGQYSISGMCFPPFLAGSDDWRAQKHATSSGRKFVSLGPLATQFLEKVTVHNQYFGTSETYALV